MNLQLMERSEHKLLGEFILTPPWRGKDLKRLND